MIRDWANLDEYNYGYEDSQEYLDNEVLDIKPSHTPDMKDLRRYLRDSFVSIDCFLMPNPGHEVVDCKNFDGRWAKLDKSFISYLKTLVSTEFSPKSLLKKKVFGEEATAQKLYEAIKGFQQILNSPEVPSGRSMYNLVAKDNLNNLCDSLLNEYKTLIMEKFATVKSVDELKAAHDIALKSLAMKYGESKKMGNERLHQNYYKKLTKGIEEFFEAQMKLVTTNIEIVELNSEVEEAEKKEPENYKDANQCVQNIVDQILIQVKNFKEFKAKVKEDILKLCREADYEKIGIELMKEDESLLKIIQELFPDSQKPPIAPCPNTSQSDPLPPSKISSSPVKLIKANETNFNF